VRVLIAEDREIERRILSRAVRDLGHECLAASDGAEAWHLFQTMGADVVISDWVMPGIEGPELCRRVRAHPGSPYTYVILLSVLDDRSHTLAGMEAGADDYLTKPLDLARLEACLVAAARVTGLHRQVSRRVAEHERTLARREALLRVARRCAAAGDGERLLTELLAEAVVLLEGSAGVVSRCDAACDALRPLRSTIPAATDPADVAVGQRLSSRAAAARTPVIFNDELAETGADSPPAASGVRAGIAVPLVDEAQGKTLGALAVISHHAARRFGAEDIEILEQLARIGAAALVGLDRARVEGALVALQTLEGLHPEPAREPNRRRGRVPRQPTPLIGREREVEAIRARLLDGDTRLLTLTGPAGIGKTRLAMGVAETLVEAFDDGVFVVDLASVFDPARVLPAIAEKLGIGAATEQPLGDHLQQYLTSRRVLLILDNFEQVLGAGPSVAELVAACPAARALVTSRQPLQVRSEREFRLTPLALPDVPRPSDVSVIARAPAVALFVARAQAVDPHFELNAANADAVAQTCRLLDGLPLAIELAAARTRVLSPQSMPHWVDGSLALLGGCAPDRPQRHQTLRSAIAWSFALLTPDEQHLFRQLAVFAGGFTLEAASTVIESAGGRAIEVLDVVAELVAKSLVSPDADVDGEPRFRLLQTIRAYAFEQLVASDGRARAQQRHAAFFLALAERAEAESHGRQQLVWLNRLTAEHDNLRAALRWSAATGDIETELRLATALAWFWEARGYLSEGREALDAALGRSASAAASANATAPLLVRARAQAAAGRLALLRQDLATAGDLLEASLAILRQHQDNANSAVTLATLARVRHRQGSQVSARSLAHESLAQARKAGDAWILAESLDALGELAVGSGDWVAARNFHQRGMAIWQQLEDRWRLAVGLEEAACRMAAQHVPDLALRLAGAASALREAIGIRLGPAAQAALDRWLEPCRQTLGDAASAIAWADGLATPPEQLWREALTPPAESPASSSPPPAPSPATVGSRPMSALTERQQSVAELVALGYSNRQIADELHLSERTVETHVRQILHKLVLVSRTQLAAWVVEQRLAAGQTA
jgi:predicted ATPase/DNA-binding NarL/FixJ family response regulator